MPDATRNEVAAKELEPRTLMNLYNVRPQWLADAHANLDATVAEAYWWDVGISFGEALGSLLVLNFGDALVALTDIERNG